MLLQVGFPAFTVSTYQASWWVALMPGMLSSCFSRFPVSVMLNTAIVPRQSVRYLHSEGSHFDRFSLGRENAIGSTKVDIINWK